MTFTARTRKIIGQRLQQPGQRFPVAAEPGEQHHAQQQENGSRSQSRFGPPQTTMNLSAQVPAPKDKCGESQREEVKNGGLLAREHQRSAGASQRGLPGGVVLASTPSGQNQSKCGSDKNRLMNEISIVVNGQRSAGKQQRRDHAGHESEHFDRRAKEQNRDTSGQDRSQAQFRFREVGKCPCPLHSGQRQGKCGQRRTMAVLGIVGERFTSQQLSNDVRVNGFIRVHGPLAQLRQAEEKSEKREEEKSSPASPDGRFQAAGLPHTSTSM